ncbi:MAG: HIT family hydrolase [Candidatus Magasanikbacteria bacterium CG11_big_fil_rev_8_21_14_0_20_39_34]|uniref:HIT family hydrolase n=1 Tax=Candidatus Magasanikbacteria bacterium CG11_big_fil_rev_8_21_14_0_20_39_34 TaxID=1974653 RepID=A0A2H0N5R0_9BACT|nr:MAG: HIT family hydrolase [Candidatus Magasanikbacteria bacterium CG11_big_fil_rev_8_21_14_0_20_39_34]
MTDTIFDKILSGEIPNYTVYEDENVLAFLDIFPLSKGHTVVIPKKGSTSLLDYSDEDLMGLLPGVKQAMAKIKAVLQPDGFNIGINDGPVAGQSVPYLHVHIIPRWENDGGGSLHSIVKNPSDVPLEDLALLFK